MTKSETDLILKFLPQRLQLGLRVVVDLSHYSRGGVPVSAQKLAKSYGLKARALESITSDLAEAGLIKGLRGPKGGYVLALERRKITLETIALALLTSGSFQEDADFLPSALKSVLVDIEARFFEALGEYALDQFEDAKFAPARGPVDFCI